MKWINKIIGALVLCIVYITYGCMIHAKVEWSHVAVFLVLYFAVMLLISAFCRHKGKAANPHDES